MLGASEPNREFSVKTIGLKDPVFIIMTSDGIMDQLNMHDQPFGNEEFQTCISELYQLDSEAMAESFESRMQAWMKGVTQQDDQLLIGIKIM